MVRTRGGRRVPRINQSLGQDSRAPRTKVSGLRQTATRLSGRDACRGKLWISDRDEKRFRIWDKGLACLPTWPPFHRSTPSRPAGRPCQRIGGGLPLGQSCKPSAR